MTGRGERSQATVEVAETHVRPVAEGVSIRVENDAGRIDIAAWDQPRLEVEALKHGPDDAAVEAIRVEVADTSAGLLVTYTADQLLPDCWVDFTVRAPAASVLDLHNASGVIGVTGFAGPARASTASGAIVAAHLGGETTLTTASGAISGQGLQGGVWARSAAGSVRLRGPLRGNHRVETASGSISIEGLEGAVEARSASGDIEVRGRLEPGSRLRSVAGDIRVGLAGGSGVSPETITASSTSGHVDVREV